MQQPPNYPNYGGWPQPPQQTNTQYPPQQPFQQPPGYPPQQWQQRPTMPPPLPKPPKKRHPLLIPGIVAVVVALLIMTAIYGGNPPSGQQQQTTPTAVTQATPTTAPTDTPTAAPTPTDTPTPQPVHYPPTTHDDLQGLAALGDASAVHEFHSESTGLTGACPQPKREVTVDPSITGKQLAEDLLAYFYSQQLDSNCGSLVLAYHNQSEANDTYTAGRINFDATDSSGAANTDPNATGLQHTLTLDVGDIVSGQEYAVTY